MSYKYDRIYITEKSSQVTALAAVEDAEIQNGIGYNHSKKIAIVPLQGHGLINEDVIVYAKQFNSFHESSLSKFPNKLKLRENSSIKHKVDAVLAHIKEAKEIVIATDQDNEGAAIAVNIIEKANALDRVAFMLSMGSTHAIELRKSIDNPSNIPYLTMAEAGRARAWVDFVEGMYLSRALSYYLGNNYQIKLNFGGVKAPLTYMVVQRDLAFENHVKSYYWTVKGIAVFNGQEFPVKLQRKIIDEKGVISWDDKFESEIMAKEALEKFIGKKIKVKTFNNKISTTIPPKLYDLTSLQADMSKLFKVGDPIVSMEIAQKNYDAPVSIQTYPRTEIPYLKESEFVDVPTILSKLKGQGIVEDTILDNILNSKIPKRKSTFNDKEVVAHGAIIPTLEGDYSKWLEKLSPLHKNMFEIISKRYIANFMQDYTYKSIIGATDEIDDFRIYFSETIPVDAGWKAIYSDSILDEIKSTKREIPDLKNGDEIELKSGSSTRNETAPKPRFTMAQLLMAMKTIASLYPDNPEIKEELGLSGLGTPATRTSIINQVMDPNKNQGEPMLIEQKGRIISTKKARDYILSMPEDLVSPVKRARLSKELKKVERGETPYDELIEKYRDIVKDNIDIIKKLTAEKGPLKGAEITGLGECPLCKKGVIVEKNKLYDCSESRYKKLEDGTYENNGCQYKIFKSSLSKLGKKNITKTEITKMLKTGSATVSLVSQKTSKSYDGKMVFDQKWGVKIEFN